MSDPISLSELSRRLVEFREERDWGQFHSIKNLMLSLALEAAEMMELTQWKPDGALEKEIATGSAAKGRLEEEAADVLLYLLLICERADIDLGRAAVAKIEANARKYPVEKARGRADKYTEL